jgi:tripartite ATP-independent transporter DctP family solute receptor
MGKPKIINCLQIILLAAIIVFCNGFVSSGNAQTYVIKGGHVNVTSMPEHMYHVGFKKWAEDHAPGKLKVEIYPNSQLGDHRQLVEQTMTGTIQMTCMTASGLAQIFPPIQIFDLPYMFADVLSEYKVIESPLIEELNQEMIKKTGLRLMGAISLWPRSFFNTKRQVRTPADLQGLKIRTINAPLQVKLAEAMGAKATPIAWGELYGALKAGVVDGSKHGIVDAVQKKFYEAGLKYVTLDEHCAMWIFAMMNEKFYQSLPEELRLTINDANLWAKEFTKANIILMQDENKRIWLEKGGQIYIPVPEEKAQFVEKSKEAWKWFVGEYGPYWVERAVYYVNKGNQELGNPKLRPPVSIPK